MNEASHAVAIPLLSQGLIQAIGDGPQIETLNIYGNITNVQGNANINISYNTMLPKEPGILQRIREVVAMLETHTKARFRQIQHEIAGRRTPRTNQGFIAKEEVQRWRKTPNGFIWIRGGPGAGKTFLLCGLVERADSDRGTSWDRPVVCVYLRYTEQLTTWDIVLGIIVQLVQYCEELPQALSMVEDSFKRHKPSLPDIQKLLNNILPLFDDVDIYVDGLDEAMDASVQAEVSSILSSCPARVVVTSRDLPILENDVKRKRGDKGIVFIEVSAEAHDIALFVEDAIRRAPGLEALLERFNLRTVVEVTVQSKAKGMFLHAALHMRALQDCFDIQSIQEVLDNFPSGIEYLYNAAVQRIQKQPSRRSNLALRTLIWVVHSKRLLTVEELVHAVAVSPDSYKFEQGRLAPEEYLVSICCGLLSIERNSKGSIMRLIHYTGQSALLAILATYSPHPLEIIVKTCLTRVIQCGTQNFTGGPDQLQACFKKNPLLEYSHQFGPQHVREAISTNTTSSHWINDYVRSCTRLPYLPHPDNHVHVLQPLHIAVLFDMVDLIQAFTQTGSKPDLQTIYLHVTKPAWSTLLLAAAEGCKNSVEALLRCYGLDPNSANAGGLTPLMLAAQNGHSGVIRSLSSDPRTDFSQVDSRGRTALMQASDKGQAGSVEALLDPGSHPNHRSKIEQSLNQQDNDGNSALIMASSKGNVDVVRLLIGAPGIQVNQQSEIGSTALIWASGKGFDDIVELLLGVPGLRVNQEDEDGESALSEACWRGHAKVVRLLLSAPDIQVNQGDNIGRTALHGASYCGYHDIVQLLLAFPGIQVNQQDDDGDSALIKASREGHPKVVQLLVNNPDIQVNQQARNGYTALIHASVSGYDEIVDILLGASNVLVNKQDEDGESALIKAIRNHHPKVIRLFAQRNDTTGDQLSNTAAALIWVSEYGSDEIVQFLLGIPGLGVSYPNSDGETALTKAARANRPNIVRLLLIHSTDIEVNQWSNRDGYTALIYASLHGYDEVVELLLGAPGISVDQRARDGETALMKAIQSNHPKVVRLLLSSGQISRELNDRYTMLAYASSRCRDVIVKILIDAPGVEVNQQDRDGESLLIKACRDGHPMLVSLLLSTPDILVNQTDNYDRSPLIWASYQGHDGIVELLLGAPGVRVNHQDAGRQSALIHATWRGHLKVVKLLLSAPDIQVSQQDQFGQTAIIKASCHGHIEIVELLLTTPGVQLNQQDTIGESALIKASFIGHFDVVNLLLGTPGIEVNQQCDFGNSALIHASRHGDLTIVHHLLGVTSIDVNLRNDDGDSALSEACRGGHENVVQALLAVPGVDVNTTNDKGETPLKLARERIGGGDDAISRALQLAGARENAGMGQ